MTQLILILDNLRSAANVGSILRTADAAGVERVLCVGTTPYIGAKNDGRDPVVRRANMRAISKTALGAELTVQTEYFTDSAAAIAACRAEGRTIYGLEIAPIAKNLLNFEPTLPTALIVGSEVDGLSQDTMEACDAVLTIPQRGSKESLNVAVATGIAVYQLLIKTF